MTEDWARNSNAATYLQLGPDTNSSNSSGHVFHPEFTYPIFGEAETIYGYRDLRIQLGFTTGSLRPNLLVRWAKSKADSKEASGSSSSSSKKPDAQESKLIDPVQKTLLEYLPKPANETNSEQPEQGETFVAQDEASWNRAFEAAQQKDAESFRPMGEKIAEWSVASNKSSTGGKAGKSSKKASGGGEVRHFEVYRCTWDTPGFQAFHQRFRIFTLFYIEAASYIDEEEPGWEFLVLFERSSTPANEATASTSSGEQYHFVGFTSLYRFWTWPDSSRIRLSQFLILPPYQKLGLGTRLYTLVHDWVLLREETAAAAAQGASGQATSSRVAELTVEDPSEQFDRLRDGADLKRLLQPETLGPVPLFARSSSDGSQSKRARINIVAQAVKEGKLTAPLDWVWSEETRKAYKIAPRQWARLMEMIQLLLLSSAVPIANDDEGEEEEGSRKEERAQFEALSKAFRLQVKARLYKHNRDVLVQMEADERKRKLQETYENLLEHDYAELIGVDVEPFLPVERIAGAEGSGEEEDEEEEEDGKPGAKGRGTIRKRSDQAQNGGPPGKVARFA